MRCLLFIAVIVSILLTGCHSLQYCDADFVVFNVRTGEELFLASGLGWAERVFQIDHRNREFHTEQHEGERTVVRTYGFTDGLRRTQSFPFHRFRPESLVLVGDRLYVPVDSSTWMKGSGFCKNGCGVLAFDFGNPDDNPKWVVPFEKGRERHSSIKLCDDGRIRWFVRKFGTMGVAIIDAHDGTVVEMRDVDSQDDPANRSGYFDDVSPSSPVPKYVGRKTPTDFRIYDSGRNLVGLIPYSVFAAKLDCLEQAEFPIGAKQLPTQYLFNCSHTWVADDEICFSDSSGHWFLYSVESKSVIESGKFALDDGVRLAMPLRKGCFLLNYPTYNSCAGVKFEDVFSEWIKSSVLDTRLGVLWVENDSQTIRRLPSHYGCRMQRLCGDIFLSYRDECRTFGF